MSTTCVAALCPGCGELIERDIPSDLPDWMRGAAVGMVLWHEECLATDEADAGERELREEERRCAAASGMPAAMRELGRTVELSDALSGLASAWAAGDERHVVLCGPFGVGKTTVAAVAATRRFALGKSAYWTTAPFLFARMGSGFGSSERDDALGILTGITALVLDDLDKARPTAYAAEQVFIAIDRRLSANAPLLVTSNLRPDELAARWPEPYGEAIASRLGGGCRVVEMRGEDRRLAA